MSFEISTPKFDISSRGNFGTLSADSTDIRDHSEHSLQPSSCIILKKPQLKKKETRAPSNLHEIPLRKPSKTSATALSRKLSRLSKHALKTPEYPDTRSQLPPHRVATGQHTAHLPKFRAHDPIAFCTRRHAYSSFIRNFTLKRTRP